MASNILPLVEPRRVTFKVYGIPKPKGSARGFVVMKAGKKPRAIVTSDNKSLKSWEAAVRDAARDVVGEAFFTEAVALKIDFWFPRSKAAKKRPYMITIPDLSKLVRGAEDALNAVLFADDKLIVLIEATKRYVDEGPAGASITVEEMPVPIGYAPPAARAQTKTRARATRTKADPWAI